MREAEASGNGVVVQVPPAAVSRSTRTSVAHHGTSPKGVYGTAGERYRSRPPSATTASGTLSCEKFISRGSNRYRSRDEP